MKIAILTEWNEFISDNKKYNHLDVVLVKIKLANSSKYNHYVGKGNRILKKELKYHITDSNFISDYDVFDIALKYEVTYM